MVNGVFDLRPGAGDFRLQRGDTGVKIGHGQGVQILSDKLGQGVVSLAGQVAVHVHERNVDRGSASVNKVVAPLAAQP